MCRNKRHTNLTLFQKYLLNLLYNLPEIIVIQTDKNLGHAIIEKEKWIQLILQEHLFNTSTYQQMGVEEARDFEAKTRDLAVKFFDSAKRQLVEEEIKFLS